MTTQEPARDGADVEDAATATGAINSTHDAGAAHDTEVGSLLSAVTTRLEGAEDRPGQREMAERVAAAIAAQRHLVVQAGTGTGKTLAYLVPIATSGTRTVVATATKALQDQLAEKDLPFLVRQLGDAGPDLDWAVLKGRSNYVCLQRLREMADPDQGQLELDEMAITTRAEIKRLAEWAGSSRTGDIAELTWSPSDAAWSSVSVGSDECPGADRCPLGDVCFAEAARDRARAADVVVVNTHLYGLDVAADGAILPEHDLVVFDEAHGLEDIMSDTIGAQVSPGRFTALSATVRRIVDDPRLVGAIAELSELVREALADHLGTRLPDPLPEPVQDALTTARLQMDVVAQTLHGIETPVQDAQQRKLRAQTATARTIEQLDVAIERRDGSVTFVAGSPGSPRLEVAPLDVGPVLGERVWQRRTAVLTSATIPSSLAARVGIPPADVDEVDVGSPFDYETQSLLYCALHLPNPNAAGFRSAVHDELDALINAAGGRTLALFTSWSAMDEAAAALRERIDHPILTQRDLPKPALVRAFSEREETCLFATAGLFQGVDVPGATLSLVVIDRLPFPRPDDPLLSARRDRLGPAAFGEIDLPRASTMLAQAAGRLIRTRSDRGVVAVMDPRLGTARYRWDIVRALPPMRRTRDREEVERFLRDIRA